MYDYFHAVCVRLQREEEAAYATSHQGAQTQTTSTSSKTHDVPMVKRLFTSAPKTPAKRGTHFSKTPSKILREICKVVSFLLTHLLRSFCGQHNLGYICKVMFLLVRSKHHLQSLHINIII